MIEITPVVCEIVTCASRSASWVVVVVAISSRTIKGFHVTDNNEGWYRTHQKLMRGYIELLRRYYVDEP
jgi:hypothetical protein